MMKKTSTRVLLALTLTVASHAPAYAEDFGFIDKLVQAYLNPHWTPERKAAVEAAKKRGQEILEERGPTPDPGPPVGSIGIRG